MTRKQKQIITNVGEFLGCAAIIGLILFIWCITPA